MINIFNNLPAFWPFFKGGKTWQAKRKYESAKSEVRKKRMTKRIDVETLAQVRDEYAYVSTTLSFASQRFALLANQGIAPADLQEVIKKLRIEKAQLAVEIYMISDEIES